MGSGIVTLIVPVRRGGREEEENILYNVFQLNSLYEVIVRLCGLSV